MRQKTGTHKAPVDKFVKDIRRRTRKQHSAEEEIRIVLEGLRGEDSIADFLTNDHPIGRSSVSFGRRFAIMPGSYDMRSNRY